MSDKKEEKAEATQQTSGGKGDEATPMTSPVSEEKPVEKGTQKGVSEQGAERSVSEPEEKQLSRKERRIAQLESKKAGIEKVLEKLKDKETISTQDIPKEFIGGDEPLIKPEELEEGIDPQELEKRVQARVEKTKQEAVQEAINRVKYENLIREHIQEVETAPEKYPELNPKSESYDPDFEQEVSRLYELQNVIYNPLTGQKEFLPVVKLSEVYQQVKDRWEKIQEKGASRVAGKIEEQAGSSAVAPSASGERETSLEDLRKSLWKNPRAVAEKLSQKLPVEE